MGEVVSLYSKLIEEIDILINEYRTQMELEIGDMADVRKQLDSLLDERLDLMRLRDGHE